MRRLFAEASPGERVNLAFLGGEPLVNRTLIRRATELAAGIASERNIPIGFSITTNGTLAHPGRWRLLRALWLCRDGEPRWRRRDSRSPAPSQGRPRQL